MYLFAILCSHEGTIQKSRKTSRVYYTYSIRHDLSMNVGYTVKQEIPAVACTKTCCLSFPSIITHFCAIAGLDIIESHGTILPPLSNLNRRTYNELAALRNELQLFVYNFDCRVRARGDDDVAGPAQHDATGEQ
ncbi:hypothetical protein ACOSQ2_016758 [Xanthoceras sorbifolium]